MDHSQSGFYVGGPPIMNHPPRLFGSGTFDASQMPSGNMFAHDDMDDHNDGGDAKRRRIARVRTHGGTRHPTVVLTAAAGM
jgi:hypothetical protein